MATTGISTSVPADVEEKADISARRHEGDTKTEASKSPGKSSKRPSRGKIHHAQVTQDEINDDIPEFRMTDDERTEMRGMMSRAKAGDGTAQRALANWLREKIYRPIRDDALTPRISSEHRNVVAKKIAETGNNIGNLAIVTLLNFVLEEYPSYAAFARDPDSAEILKDGVGGALQYAFKNRHDVNGA